MKRKIVVRLKTKSIYCTFCVKSLIVENNEYIYMLASTGTIIKLKNYQLIQYYYI